MFCGAAVEVLTALEVRRKVCVAPLGLRALEVKMISTDAGVSSRAPEWMRWRWRSHGWERALDVHAEGWIDVPFRAGIAWLRILLIAARRRRSKGRGCHCIGRWLEVNDQLGRSNRRLWVGLVGGRSKESMALKCGNELVVGGEGAVRCSGLVNCRMA